MDWNAAIEKNREALKRVLASLVAMAALATGAGAAATLPRHLHRAVLRLLRPAEAAVRRLIVVMARGMVLAVRPARHKSKLKPKPTILHSGTGTGIIMPSGAMTRPPRGVARTFSLPLLDPLRRWPGPRRQAPTSVPRILVPGFGTPFPVTRRRPPSADDPVTAARLASRLAALASALDDLPKQARRFARWQARQALPAGQGPVRRRWPMKPGRPPGWRGKATHEVHDVLNVVHGLALWALEPADTS